VGQSWLGKSEQRDKRNFCLTAAKIAANQERNHVKTTAPEPYPGFQGQGGFSRREGGQDAGRVGAAIRRSPEPDHAWKTQFLESVTAVFGSDARVDPRTAVDVKTLHAKIGELTLENDFFVRCARQGRLWLSQSVKGLSGLHPVRAKFIWEVMLN